jgi:hypothetical protein
MDEQVSLSGSGKEVQLRTNESIQLVMEFDIVLTSFKVLRTRNRLAYVSDCISDNCGLRGKKTFVSQLTVPRNPEPNPDNNSRNFLKTHSTVQIEIGRAVVLLQLLNEIFYCCISP